MNRLAAAALAFVLLLSLPVGRAFARPLAELADSLLSCEPLLGSSHSVLIYSLDRGSVVYESGADRLLTPASVTKLLTSAAALDGLGSDFCFTTLYYAGGDASTDGVLDGDLIVIAGGDCAAEVKADDSLRAPLLRAVADSLMAHGLREVRGDIVVRTWPYRLEGAAPAWEIGDVNGGFAPAVDGFGFNSNVCHLQVMPAESAAAAPTYILDPPFAPLHIRSEVVTAGAGTAPWIDLQFHPMDTSVTLSGEIALDDDGEFLWVPMQDPARYFGCALQDALVKRGVVVRGRIVVDRSSLPLSDSAVLLYAHRSQSLSAYLALMNKESDNYTAEYVARALAVSASGTGERRAGLNAIGRFLNRIGISKREFFLADASGLARQNEVSARALVTLLCAMRAHPAGETFIASLSMSGKDGTLQYRLSGEGLAGSVHAKTGTIGGVSALAGYATNPQGETFAFAMLFNHVRTSQTFVHSVQDRILESLLLGPSE